MVRSMGRGAVALACVALLWGCADENKGGDDPHGELECDDGNGLDEYVSGLSRTTPDGRIELAILDAVPAPPDAGQNDWSLSVKWEDGTPFEEGTIRIRPWMPLHGHGTSPERYNAVHLDGDEWEVTGVNFTMPGLWEVNFEITPEGEAMQQFMFRFCAQG